MVNAADHDALRGGLARTLAVQDGWQNPDALWTDNIGLISRGCQGNPVYQDYLEEAGALISGPLAPFLAKAESADRLAAENAALRAALEGTRAAADDLVPVCLDEGDNRAAGALQFISGFISDQLAALRTDPPAGTDAPVREDQPR